MHSDRRYSGFLAGINSPNCSNLLHLLESHGHKRKHDLDEAEQLLSEEQERRETYENHNRPDLPIPNHSLPDALTLRSLLLVGLNRGYA